MSWTCGWLEQSEILLLVFRKTVYPLMPPLLVAHWWL
jgi:hypothetical protein